MNTRSTCRDRAAAFAWHRRPARAAALVLLCQAASACGGSGEPLARGTFTLSGTPDAASEASAPGYESVLTGQVAFAPDGPARADSASGASLRGLRGGGSLRLCTAAGRCATRRVTVGTFRTDGTRRSYQSSAGEVRLVLDQDAGGPSPPVIVGADLRARGAALEGTYVVIFFTGSRNPPSVTGVLRLTPAW